MYIIIAIIIFGVLIAVHELGHFLASKWMGVKVNEFSIGMGPAIIKKQGKETLYALRALPIGGYCAIEGEDGQSEDERSFAKKAMWKRFIILFAGAFMNFVIGFVIVLIICARMPSYSTTQITGFMDGFPLEGQQGLMAGDRIISVDGHKTNLLEEFSFYMDRGNGETVDIVIERDGEKVKLDDLGLKLRDYVVDGETVKKYGIIFTPEDRTFFRAVQQGWYNSEYFVKLVWISLGDLVSGRVKFSEMSGVVGAVAAINEVGEKSDTVSQGLLNVFYISALLAVNLAVMNLLPIPGLDGGHIFLMIISSIIALIIGHKPNPKAENLINGIGLGLLMVLMVVLLFSDIYKLI